MPSDTAINYVILSKYAFGAVGNSMILPKYAFRHSQKLYDIVKDALGAVRNSMILPARSSMILFKYTLGPIWDFMVLLQ